MTESDQKPRHFGKIAILFAVFLLVCALALAEWLLTPKDGRFAADARSSGGAPGRHLQLREWRPNTTYRMAPPAARLRYGKDEVLQSYDLEIDADGFVAPASVHEKPDASIVFLGGSTTESLFVLPENRFPHLAARLLEERLGAKINGLNAGRSGNNTMHSLLLMLGKVVPQRPDAVVLMHAANDLGVLSKTGGYWEVSDGRRLVIDETYSVSGAVRSAIKATIPNTSNALRRGWRRLRQMLSGSQANAAGAQDGAAGTPLPDVKGAEDFASALTSFVEVARAWGMTPVLMTQFHVRAGSKKERKSDFLAREQLAGAVGNRKKFKSSHAAYNEIVRQVAQRTGVQLIDLAAARQWAYGDVYDGLHLTDSGSRIAAELVADGLQDTIRQRIAR
ncbi:MAG: SGNH/GDSL hydrolase family protein [Pseudomonadota bacterium]